MVRSAKQFITNRLRQDTQPSLYRLQTHLDTSDALDKDGFGTCEVPVQSISPAIRPRLTVMIVLNDLRKQRTKEKGTTYAKYRAEESRVICTDRGRVNETNREYLRHRMKVPSLNQSTSQITISCRYSNEARYRRFAFPFLNPHERATGHATVCRVQETRDIELEM